jgi:hypothetical protein
MVRMNSLTICNESTIAIKEIVELSIHINELSGVLHEKIVNFVNTYSIL